MLKRIDPDALIASARRVVAAEAEGLSRLAAALDGRFAEAAGRILGAPGRVILSGIGKSGHVARKIAATLASTGTPAHFVHAVEASHGDLGALAPGDVLVVLSNSGETAELEDLITYSRRHGIPLIAITSSASSTLARAADTALVLPAAAEGCAQGLVPTTSTTMALALGDALAVALMEQRQFTPEHFRAFHPGGTLGARLIRVRDIMHPDPPCVAGDTPMGEALVEMSRKGLGVVAVRGEDGALAGIITDGDLRRNLAGLLERRAADVMTATPRTIGPDALAEEAVALMNAHAITSLPVVEPPGSRMVVGLLHIHDCLRAGIA